MSRTDKFFTAERRRDRKRFYLISAAVLAAAYTLCGFVISPLYTSLMNDISYSGGFLTDLLRLLNTVVELFAVSVAYGAMVMGLYRFGASRYIGGFGIFLGATAYKYAVNMMISWSFLGRIPLEWTSDILNLLFFVSVEMLQLLLVALIVNKTVSASGKKARYLEDKGALCEIYAEAAISKIYDAKNPLLRASVYSAVVVFASKLLGEVYSDLVYILLSGLPQKISTVILMVLNYLSCALYGASCYAFMLLTLIYLKGKKKNM